jgi:hypothetical protein
MATVTTHRLVVLTQLEHNTVLLRHVQPILHEKCPSKHIRNILEITFDFTIGPYDDPDARLVTIYSGHLGLPEVIGHFIASFYFICIQQCLRISGHQLYVPLLQAL